jgi:hypothetical protein
LKEAESELADPTKTVRDSAKAAEMFGLAGGELNCWKVSHIRFKKGHCQMKLNCGVISSGTSSPSRYHHNLELFGVQGHIDAPTGRRPERLRRRDSCFRYEDIGISYSRDRPARNVDEPVNEFAISNFHQCLLLQSPSWRVDNAYNLAAFLTSSGPSSTSALPTMNVAFAVPFS